MQHDHITAGELFRFSPRSNMNHVLCIQNIWDKIKVFQRIYLPKWSDISKIIQTIKHVCLHSLYSHSPLQAIESHLKKDLKVK